MLQMAEAAMEREAYAEEVPWQFQPDLSLQRVHHQ